MTVPMTFDDFIGNEHAVTQLKLLATTAKEKDGALPHIGIFGPPGHGKTTLAQIMADYVNRRYVYVNGVAVRSPTTIRGIITHPDNLAKGAVIVIDECHRLPNSVQDNLLSALEQPAILVTTYKDQIIRDPLPTTISFVLATTNQGLVRDALLSRLETVELREYTTGEKQVIAVKYLNRVHKIDGKMMDIEAILEIGRRARSGRHVVKCCDNLIRYMMTNKLDKITVEVVNNVFAIMDIDHNGLTLRDRQLLTYLQQAGGCGLDTLEAFLNVPKKDIKDKIEPFLLRRRLIARQANGRVITERGMSAVRGDKVDV